MAQKAARGPGGRPLQLAGPLAVVGTMGTAAWMPATSGVVVDLIQNFETYYFHESDRRMSLGTLVEGLDRCVNLLDSRTSEEAQALGRGLGRVLDHLFATLHEQYDVPAERRAALNHLAVFRDGRPTLAG